MMENTIFLENNLNTKENNLNTKENISNSEFDEKEIRAILELACLKSICVLCKKILKYDPQPRSIYIFHKNVIKLRGCNACGIKFIKRLRNRLKDRLKNRLSKI